MAAMTSTIAAGVGVALSAYQAYQGAQQQEDANKAAADIAAKQKMLAETNKVAGVQVPQLGYQLAQQAQAQRSASQLQALQGAGVAGVLGGVPALNQAATAEDLQLAAALDSQKAERDQFVAAQEQAAEARRVQQQSDMLNNQMVGAQNARAMGQLNEQSGYAGMVVGLGNAANEYMSAKALYKENPKISVKDNIQSNNPTSASDELTKNLNPIDLKAPKGNQYSWMNSKDNNPLNLEMQNKNQYSWMISDPSAFGGF